MAAPIGCVGSGGLEKILTSGITGQGKKFMSHKFVKTWLIISKLAEHRIRCELSLLIIFTNEKDLGSSNTYQFWCYMLQHRL